MDHLTQSFMVIAQLDRRRREYRDVGWVYIMRNSAFREPLVKIGKSSRPPMIRAQELGSETSVPEGFELIHFVHTSDHHQVEAIAHRELAKYRKSRSKEFFELPLPLAVLTLEQIADSFPILIGPRQAPSVLPQPFQPFAFQCAACGLQNRVRQLLVPLRVRCAKCQTELDTSPGGQ